MSHDDQQSLVAQYWRAYHEQQQMQQQSPPEREQSSWTDRHVQLSGCLSALGGMALLIGLWAVGLVVWVLIGSVIPESWWGDSDGYDPRGDVPEQCWDGGMGPYNC